MSRSEIMNLLKVITKALNELDESQYRQLLDGKGRIKFIELEPREKIRSSKASIFRKLKLTENEIQYLASQLQASKTREDAIRLLHGDNQQMVKESLVSLAKLLGVHIIKNDTSSVIEDKIVEFVVGGRLRTEAIRGLKF